MANKRRPDLGEYTKDFHQSLGKCLVYMRFRAPAYYAWVSYLSRKTSFDVKNMIELFMNIPI